MAWRAKQSCLVLPNKRQPHFLARTLSGWALKCNHIAWLLFWCPAICCNTVQHLRVIVNKLNYRYVVGRRFTTYRPLANSYRPLTDHITFLYTDHIPTTIQTLLPTMLPTTYRPHTVSTTVTDHIPTVQLVDYYRTSGLMHKFFLELSPRPKILGFWPVSFS